MALSDKTCITNLPAEDIGRAVDFYRDKMGLNVVMNSETNALFEAGNGSRIFMYKKGIATAENTALAFMVEDVEAEVATLKGRGVTFEHYEGTTDENGIASNGPMKIAWFRDTEGNIISVQNPFPAN